MSFGSGTGAHAHFDSTSAPVKEHPEVVLLAVRQVLLVALSNHPASVDDHQEVVLLPVEVVLLIILSYHPAPAKSIRK